MIEARHYFATFFRCNKDIINDVDVLNNYIEQCILGSGANILGCLDKKLENNNYSLVFLLMDSESTHLGHCSVHVHPENNTVFIDFLTCGNRCNYNKFERSIINALDPREIVYDFSVRTDRHLFL